MCDEELQGLLKHGFSRDREEYFAFLERSRMVRTVNTRQCRTCCGRGFLKCFPPGKKQAEIIPCPKCGEKRSIARRMRPDGDLVLDRMRTLFEVKNE